MKLNDRKELNQLLKWHLKNFDKLCGLKKVNGKIKMFNLIPETARFKKIKSSLKKAVIHLNLLVLIIFFACGSDNPVNNGNNPPVSNGLITLDSFAVYSPSQVKDTSFFFTSSSSDSVNFTFDVATNCSLGENVNLNISLIDTINNYVFSMAVNEISLLNQTYSFSTLCPAINYRVKIALLISASNNKFLRIKNFKFLKL